MSSYDLSNLYVKFQECPPDKKLVEWASELSVFPEFINCDETIIKIAILSGDIDSPFLRISDRETMIRAIFDYLKIDMKLEDNRDLFKGCVEYRNDQYIFAWSRYLQILHETDFTDWLLAKKDYDYFLTKSHEPQGEKESDKVYLQKRNEIRETIKQLGKDVRELEAKIFPDSKAAREVAIAEAKKRVKLYAESYAETFNHY